jgi:hypothetical protein
VRIEFTYARPPEYFRASWRPAARRAMRPFLVAALVVAIAFGAVALSWGGAPGATMALCGATFALVIVNVGLRRYRRALVVPPAFVSPRHWLITDEVLSSDTELTSSTWDWRAVRAVAVRPEAFVFAQEGSTLFDVPREPLTAAEDAELLDRIRVLGLTDRYRLVVGRRH